MARRCNVLSLEPRSWGLPPRLAAPMLVRARGRGGGAARSSSPRTSNHSTSGLSPPSHAQTLWAIRVRSVWSVRSSVLVSRGGGAVQRGCGRRQSGQACRCAMHGLQNQCSCWALPQPRSCPRRGASLSSTISQQTLHGFPGPRGCGDSPAGILRRGTGRGTIGLLYGSVRTFLQCGVVGGAIAVSRGCLCVSVCG